VLRKVGIFDIMKFREAVLSGIELAGHIVMATFAFVLIAAAAVGLGYFLQWIGTFGAEVVPEFVKTTFHYIKIGLFVLDIGTYSLYVVTMVISFIITMLRVVQHSWNGQGGTNHA
jgi:hypothetical protein